MASMSADFHAYYNRGREQNRLIEFGKLEFARTQEIVLRHMPDAPAVIHDVGGGAGIYAYWLASLGYTVHLLDAVALHIEQAHQAAIDAPNALASMQVGDARHLPYNDATADAVLLLGPLYHLTEREDRIAALCEAKRVLKPGGVVFAATISRFASLRDGLIRRFMADPVFVQISERDLVDGQHRNPDRIPGYFATAYFHHPMEIAGEVEDAGLHVEATLAVEGMGDVVPDFNSLWNDDVLRERLLHFLRLTEAEPTLLGITGHILTVAKK